MNKNLILSEMSAKELLGLIGEMVYVPEIGFTPWGIEDKTKMLIVKEIHIKKNIELKCTYKNNMEDEECEEIDARTVVTIITLDENDKIYLTNREAREDVNKQVEAAYAKGEEFVTSKIRENYKNYGVNLDW